MSQTFHAILVDKSLQNLEILKSLKVLSQKQDGSWLLIKIEVIDENLNNAIQQIQNNLNVGKWYFHFYNEDGSMLIVVYMDKTFVTDSNRENWKDAVEYGISLEIPEKQLVFSPTRFADEEF